MPLIETIAIGVGIGEAALKIYEQLAKLERAFVVELVNATSKSMRLVRQDMESGAFGSPAPPQLIGPFDGGFFAVHTDDIATGVDGSVSYRVEGVGDFLAGFANPVLGSNWVNVAASKEFDQSLSVIGTHSDGNHATARFVISDRNPPMPQLQEDWRSCPKCQGLHYAGFRGFKGVCPAGGQHDHFGSFAYVVVFDSRPAEHVQADWRSCPKCQGLHYAGIANFRGVCPAGGRHEEDGSFHYVALSDVPARPHLQLDWQSCRRCQGMFYAPLRGVCPAGGAHDGSGSYGYVQRFV